MKVKIASLLLGTSLVLAACGGGGNNAEKDTNEQKGGTATANAEEIVQKNCISCHGNNLQGGAGPALNKIGSKYDKAEIENIIHNGKGGMPGGLLSDEEASTVAEWLSQKK